MRPTPFHSLAQLLERGGRLSLATVKALDPDDIREIGARIILSNPRLPVTIMA